MRSSPSGPISSVTGRAEPIPTRLQVARLLAAPTAARGTSLKNLGRIRTGLLVGTAALLVACAGPAGGPPGAPGTQPGAGAPAAHPKSLTVGITGALAALSIVGGSSPVGGWVAMAEILTDGLVTTDVKTPSPIGRLAERVPSL